MISVILSVFYFLFLIAKLRIHDTLMKAIVYTFLGYWCITLFLSTLNPFGLNDVSVETYAVLLLYISSFVLGCIFINRKVVISSKKVEDFNSLINVIISNKFFLIFVLSCDIFLIYLFVKEQALLTIYSAAEVRVNIDELLYEGNSFLGLGKNMVIDPITPLMTFFSGYLLLYNRKKIVPIVLVVSYAILSALLGGSRSGILRLAVYGFFVLICGKYLSTERKKIKIKILISFVLLVIIVLVVMSNMTAQRLYNTTGFSWEGVCLGAEDLSRHFVTYCVGPYRALDYSFKTDYLSQLGGYKLGSCTFGFIDGMLSLVLGIIGIKYVPSNKIVTSFVQDTWIDIGGQSFNFAYTAPFMHYMDFGYIGVIFCPFLFGIILRKIIDKFYMELNPFLLITVAYLFTVTIDSGFTWRLYRHSAFMTFFYLYILYGWYKKMHKYN